MSCRHTACWLVTLTAAAAAVFLAGCGGGTVEPMPDIPETVEYDTVKMEYGDDDGVDTSDSPGTESQRQKAVGERSGIALLSKSVVFRTNALMWYAFWLMDKVTDRRPTRRDGDTYIWVGYPKGTYVRFEATRTDEHAYRYQMLIGNGPRDNGELFAGTFTRLDPASDIQQGYGRLTFDLDVARRYGDGKSHGRLKVAFRRRNGVRQVRSQYEQFIGRNDDEPLDARNRYTQISGERTRFAFFGRKDFEPADSGNENKDEFFSIDAAWLRGRRGRTAGKIEKGNLDQPYRIDQCWDKNAKVVWEDSDPDLSGEGGEKSKCAEALGDLTLEPPTYEVPEGPPAVPEAHPEE